MRGLLPRLLERGRRRPAGGFFAAIDKPPPPGLDSAHTYLLGIPQPVVVDVRERHAVALGARVRRAAAVAGLAQDGDGVTVTLAGGERLRARYLVGCDGAHSTVRKLLGVAFPGEPARTQTLMGELEVAEPPERIAATLAEVRQTDRRLSLTPFGPGDYRVVVPAAGVSDRAAPRRPPERRRLVGPGRPPRRPHGGAGRAGPAVRPDGYVAWIGDDQKDLDTHLSRWFGEPTP